MSIKSKIAKIAFNFDNWLTGGRATRSYINRRIEEYGEVIELKIDNKSKRISVKALLNGETDPIEVNVEEYDLQGDSITIKKISSDRAWVNAALGNFVAGKSFTLPPKSVDFINDFLG